MQQFISDYVPPTDGGLVDFNVEVLCDGAISVKGKTVVELGQETYHCYFKQLADVSLPLAPAEMCNLLSLDTPPRLTPDVLQMASAPLRADEYDVLLAPLVFQRQSHQGIRVSCPADYSAGIDGYVHDSHGVFVLVPGDEPSMVAGRYGSEVAQTSPGTLYQGWLDEVSVLLLPVASRDQLDPQRVADYRKQLNAGGQPTVLAFGFYANERCLVLLVLDGHHKLEASASCAYPVHVLAFLSGRVLTNYERMTQVHAAGQLAAARQLLQRTAAGKR